MLQIETNRHGWKSPLTNYFPEVIVHSDVQEINQNTAYVICSYVARPYRMVGPEEPVLPNSVDLSAGPTPGVYFFDQDEYGPREDIFGDGPIDLRYQGRRIGLYWPGMSVLWATDWVHNPQSAALVEHIAKVLGWKKVKDESDVPSPDFTVGADPEFEVWNPQIGITTATRYMSSNTRDEIGTDGASSQLEVRPKPARCGEELYANIMGLIKKATDKWGFDVALSGHTYPLGCHSHIGASEGVAYGDFQTFASDCDRVFGRTVVELSGRARGGYKALTAWREQPHGVEYRSPATAMLALPELAIPVWDCMLDLARGKEGVQLPESAVLAATAIRKELDKGTPFGFGMKPLVIPQRRRPPEIRYGSDTLNLALSAALANVQTTRPLYIYGLNRDRGWAIGTNDTDRLARYMDAHWFEHTPASTPPGYVPIGLPWELRSRNSAQYIERLMTALAECGYIERS